MNGSKIWFPRYAYKKPYLRFLAWLFDGWGSVFFFWVKRNVPTAPVRRILLVRLDQLGDVILTLPVVESLRRSYPEAQIDMLVSPWAAEVVSLLGGIKQVFVFQNSYFSNRCSPIAAICEYLRLAILLRRRNYDLAIDFRGDVRNAVLLFLTGAKRRIGFGDTGGGFLFTDLLSSDENEHQLEKNGRCVKAVGCAVDWKAPRVSYDAGAREKLHASFGSFFSSAVRPWIVLHVGSGYPSKRWPANRFFRLAERLNEEEHASVILVGQKTEAELIQPLAAKLRDSRFLYNWVEKTSMSELCAILDEADLFIGCDSGPAHLAAILGKKTLVLFSGTNDWRFWHPRGESVHILHHEVPCSPCHARDCPLERHACMDGIEVEEVFKKARELIHG